MYVFFIYEFADFQLAMMVRMRNELIYWSELSSHIPTVQNAPEARYWKNDDGDVNDEEEMEDDYYEPTKKNIS